MTKLSIILLLTYLISIPFHSINHTIESTSYNVDQELSDSNEDPVILRSQKSSTMKSMTVTSINTSRHNWSPMSDNRSSNRVKTFVKQNGTKPSFSGFFDDDSDDSKSSDKITTILLAAIAFICVAFLVIVIIWYLCSLRTRKRFSSKEMRSPALEHRPNIKGKFGDLDSNLRLDIKIASLSSSQRKKKNNKKNDTDKDAIKKHNKKHKHDNTDNKVNDHKTKKNIELAETKRS